MIVKHDKQLGSYEFQVIVTFIFKILFRLLKYI